MQDAYSAEGNLLKLGRLRITVAPPPSSTDAFTQTLDVATASVRVQLGAAAVVQLWADAETDAVRFNISAADPVAVRAQLELWRNEPALYTADGLQGACRVGRQLMPDTSVPTPGGLAFYHRNADPGACTPGWRRMLATAGAANLSMPSAGSTGCSSAPGSAPMAFAGFVGRGQCIGQQTGPGFPAPGPHTGACAPAHNYTECAALAAAACNTTAGCWSFSVLRPTYHPGTMFYELHPSDGTVGESNVWWLGKRRKKEEKKKKRERKRGK